MVISTIKVIGKVSDLCSVTVWDETGHLLEEYNGYVPEIPALGGGDYLELEIDNATGKIIGWEPISHFPRLG